MNYRDLTNEQLLAIRDEAAAKLDAAKASGEVSSILGNVKGFQIVNEWNPTFKEEVIEGEYDVKQYLDVVRGLEDVPEGGERCRKCFELRLRETAEIAAKEGFEYFTTTLTISPLKNADVLNEVGAQAAEYVNGKMGADGRKVVFLPSDFKKKEGYKRSIELSQMFGLYRQDYCGCGFSKAERERQKAEME